MIHSLTLLTGTTGDTPEGSERTYCRLTWSDWGTPDVRRLGLHLGANPPSKKVESADALPQGEPSPDTPVDSHESRITGASMPESGRPGETACVATYDAIGSTYAATRRPDRRIGARITASLAGTDSVINVGAGAGSYEPPQTVLAIEPSQVMIRQRPIGAAPVVQARAEALPVADDAADAVMALLTVHHWADIEAGVAELRRVARRRMVILTWDQRVFQTFWLVREYLPQAAARHDARAIPLDHLVALLGGARVEPVPLPHDCTDGFAAAFWRRPQAYLDPVVRAGMSALAETGDEALQPGLDQLAADLESGRWHDLHPDLRGREDFDAGYRLLVAEL